MGSTRSAIYAAVLQGRITAITDSYAEIEPIDPCGVLGLFTGTDVTAGQAFFHARNVGHNAAS
ncbi:hypothetical protein ACFRAQ_07715 [Nocardia sp. NPDC056611]|uniref:hypothetical protein n=1 Tax=Nocardia sp. NPDC056611 TaxID=3345877 RepID=UPI00366D4EB7